MHKRVCLPKCALQQLKDAIMEGSNPIFAFLKERYGLAVRNQSENRVPVDDAELNAVARRLEGSGTNGQILPAQGNLISSTLENQNGLLQEDLTEKNSLPSKRENFEAQFHEEQISVENGHLHVAKKLKHDVFCTSTAIVHNSVLHEKRDLEGSPGIVGQQTGRQGRDLAKGSQVGSLERSCFSEDGHDEHTALKRLSRSKDADVTHSDNFLNNHVQTSHSDNEMTRDISVDDKDDNEHCAQTRTLNSSPHHKLSIDEARGNRLRGSQPSTSNGAPPDGSHWKFFADETKDDMEHNREYEMSCDSDESHDEKIDISKKKHIFLSSQCSFSQDSLAAADCTELNFCMKCNKSGQLLACSASTCPLVVHESCLGSTASFDDGGNFYCPFCAYSRAITEYLKVKENVSLSRKDLAAFTGSRNEHGLKELSIRSRSEQSQQRQDEDVNGNNEPNYNGNNANKVYNSQCRKNIGDKPHAERSTSCSNDNLPCGQGGATIISGTPPLIAKDNREGEKMGQECRPVRVLEGEHIILQSDHKHDGDNSSRRHTETVHVSVTHTEVGLQQDALQQHVSGSPPEAACPTNVNAEESFEADDDKSIGSKQYTYQAIPQLRRKKVPWTPIEEEILKEGFRRYSSNSKNIPWKKILDFGVHVFQKGRTAMDLKDKWRNICRSPKSK
ncbi:uncharacterized protein LOC132313614 isoform X2 [Cornus florida]|nr:uncharacterized protein LOC132313614 isoform X2 [Cornus florida]